MISSSRIIYYSTLCFITVAAFFPGIAHGSGPRFWQDKEITCYGNLDCMLNEVKESERIPHFRTNRSAKELVEVLRRAGRFDQLGLTETEGEHLVRTVYQKMGLEL